MTNTDQLELDALRVLAGADGIRRVLLAGLAMGTSSVQAATYLIKCRVKEHHKIVEKVKLRRAKGRPEYTARHITDIVGLRLLGLYRSGLPIIVNRFLSFVSFAQREPIALFVGPKLIDAIQEIIIYRTSDEYDPTLDLVLDEFHKRGILSEYVPDGTTPTEIAAPRVKIIKKSTEYSSIHLVLGCNGFIRDNRYIVPLEVQIRTAFEDVWGEIDHMLKYKIRDRDAAKLSEHAREEYDLAANDLRTLKGFLDNCTKVADSIAMRIDHAFGAATEESSITDITPSIHLSKLAELGLEASLQSQIDEAVDREQRLFERALDFSGGSLQAPFDDEIEELSALFTIFANTLSKYEENPSADIDIDNDTRYYLAMEGALCLYWKARLMTAARSLRNSDGPPGATMAEFDEVLAEALRIYFEVERRQRYEHDPILAFRLANVLAARGDVELALSKYEDALNKLPNANHLPSNHYMRVRIPKQYAIALWEESERIRKKGESYGAVGFMIDRRQECYKEAFEVTWSVYGKEIDPSVLDRSSRSNTEEQRLTANNVLDYALSFWRAGGKIEDLSADDELPDGWMRKLLGEVIGKGIDSIGRPAIADMVREAGRYLGDDGMEKDAASRALRLLEDSKWVIHHSSEILAEMKKDAEESLLRLVRKR